MASEHGFSVEGSDGRLVVRGELDLATSDRLLVAVAGASGTAAGVAVDLGQVSFVDSVGLRTLLQVRRDHPEVRFLGVSHQLQRLAEIAGVSEHLFGDAIAQESGSK